MSKFNPADMPPDMFTVYNAVIDDAKARPWDEGKWAAAAFSALMMWAAGDETDRPMSDIEKQSMVHILIECAPYTIKKLGLLSLIEQIKDSPF